MDEIEQRRRMESVYGVLAPRLVNYLVANGSSHVEADDVTQETFLRIWRLREKLDWDPSQLSGLAFTIARNLRRDHVRKDSHLVLQDEIRDAEESDDALNGSTALPVHVDVRTLQTTSQGDQAYIRKRLQQAFAAIPPLLREAYTLFQLQEMSIRDIARVTGATESLVKVRIFRAKEKLKPLLKDLL